ncbi:hypothetical protein Tco_1007167 [Tanacetum coccineum]
MVAVCRSNSSKICGEGNPEGSLIINAHPARVHSGKSNKMDDPNITMEEYIRLEEVKAPKHGKVFNWETAKYGKIWYDEDIHDLRSVETEFPAIAFNDGVSSEKTLSLR